MPVVAPAVSSEDVMLADHNAEVPEFRRLAAAVAARYAPSGWLARGYVAGKLRHDPVHRAVLALGGAEGLGEVVDIGCGRGQLGVALLLAERARAVLGIDLPGPRLDQAARAGAAFGLSVAARDLARDPTVPAGDTMLIVDVLYQLPRPAQRALLAAAAAAARVRVLVRTLDPGLGWRSALTVGLERASRRFSPHAGATVDPVPVAELAAVLQAAGFAVRVDPCWQGTPFANVLLNAQRLASPP
jgi:SAM-dependent methyltransferase